MKATIIAALLGVISGYQLVSETDKHHHSHHHHQADDEEESNQSIMQVDSLEKPSYHNEIKGIKKGVSSAVRRQKEVEAANNKRWKNQNAELKIYGDENDKRH